MWRKYWTIFQISWSNGFVYRLNFILWRVRSILLVLTVYFLWDAVFHNSPVIAGYTRDKILTYVFLTLVLRSVILGQRSMDAAGEISDGRLSNYLLKPLNYHFYWFTRDLADKLLNICFIIFETVTLYFILKPPIYFPTDGLVLVIFIFAVVGALFLNFVLGNIASNFSFWTPGNAWGFWFLYLVFQEFLGGVMYPIDIFPKIISGVLMLLPFPYLLYFPAGIYLGKILPQDYLQGFMVMAGWIILGLFVLKKEWRAGGEGLSGGRKVTYEKVF